MTSSDLPGFYSKPLKSAPIEWIGTPVAVVGLGCGAKSVLGEAAVRALQKAQQIYGSDHHMVEIGHIETRAEKIRFPSPFSALRDRLDQNQDKQIAVLASGDALFYGVGSWLIKLLKRENLAFYPNISSIQYGFHAVGLPWQQAEVVSLHGRPLSTLRRHLKNQQLIATFTDSTCHPQAIAKELCSQGFGASTIWVCEALGGVEQHIEDFSASELSITDQKFHDLNICIMRLSRSADAHHHALPSFPGIADHLYSTGSEPGYGMISKREIRLTILSLMQPENDEIAWDVGAGCGSVSVEWARWNHQGQIYAIEQCEERIDHIIKNSERFGTRLNLTPIQGSAPESCDGLPDPDSIFIGGSGGLRKLLEYAWQRLKPGGKLVASAVTEESIDALQDFLEGKTGRELVRLTVEKNLPGRDEMRKLAPVVVGKCIKEWDQ